MELRCVLRAADVAAALKPTDVVPGALELVQTMYIEMPGRESVSNSSNTGLGRRRLPRRRTRRIVLPSLATALIGSGALAALAIGTTSSPEDSQREVRPAAVRTLALEGSSATARERQQTTTEDFSMVAVSWPSAKTRLSGEVEIRTHAVGSSTWSGWRGLEIADTPPDLGRDGSGKGMRGTTEPLWVGPSDGIEARVSGKRSLPASMRLDLVDPGTGGSPAADSELAAFTAESASPSPTSVTGPRCLDGLTTAPATPTTGPVPKPHDHLPRRLGCGRVDRAVPDRLQPGSQGRRGSSRGGQ